MAFKTVELGIPEEILQEKYPDGSSTDELFSPRVLRILQEFAFLCCFLALPFLLSQQQPRAAQHSEGLQMRINYPVFTMDYAADQQTRNKARPLIRSDAMDNSRSYICTTF